MRKGEMLKGWNNVKGSKQTHDENEQIKTKIVKKNWQVQKNMAISKFCISIFVKIVNK